jgi:hypothetical protein
VVRVEDAPPSGALFPACPHPVPRKVWLQTSVVMPAALARRRTLPPALLSPR